jgi:Arm DNA-binding domain
MADTRQALTDKMVLNLSCADDGQYRVRDADLPGFFVLVGKRRKSFMAQGEFWRDGIREFAVQVKLGEFGQITTREARSKAKAALGSIARGQKPGEDHREAQVSDAHVLVVVTTDNDPRWKIGNT